MGLIMGFVMQIYDSETGTYTDIPFSCWREMFFEYMRRTHNPGPTERFTYDFFYSPTIDGIPCGKELMCIYYDGSNPTGWWTRNPDTHRRPQWGCPVAIDPSSV